MSSLSLGGVGARAGGLRKVWFQLENVGVDTARRLGKALKVDGCYVGRPSKRRLGAQANMNWASEQKCIRRRKRCPSGARAAFHSAPKPTSIGRRSRYPLCAQAKIHWAPKPKCIGRPSSNPLVTHLERPIRLFL